MTDIDRLMKRCQIGVPSGIRAYDELHSILAECYGALGSLQADAARYRWLREQAIDGAPGVPVIAMPNGMKSGYYLNFDTADFAIDAAMKA